MTRTSLWGVGREWGPKGTSDVVLRTGQSLVSIVAISSLARKQLQGEAGGTGLAWALKPPWPTPLFPRPSFC